MKKIFTTLFAGLMISAQVMAVSIDDICGKFDGNLNIGGDPYPNKSVYLLPGVTENTVTFVLPDFKYQSANLGNIVLPNITVSESGQLTLENSTLYIKKIQERATITILNGLEDEGITYNSIVTKDNAMVILSITAPSLSEPIFVLFTGTATTDNYMQPNGDFEGAWTNNEPVGWHSFGTATGEFVDFVKDNTDQFKPSDDVRMGSKGVRSAMLSSKMVLGAKANGNCTNGQINAGSKTADTPAANYNFSDPANSGFNTPFQGRPDSIVFWAKYVPADHNPANEDNKARMSTIITTNARYQDPEAAEDYSDVKIATAAINYAATADMDWQRISVPFTYTENTNQPAYILTTFTTNMVPGGGSSYTTGSNLSKKTYLDTVYLDDIELIYNKRISMLVRNTDPLDWDGEKFMVEEEYCDSCDTYSAMMTGVSTKTFFAFDALHKCVFAYVIADDYAHTGEYNLYRVEFPDSNTEDIKAGIEELNAREARYEKVLVNGQLIIRSNEIWYNMLGNRIK